MISRARKKFFSCSKRPALGVLFYKEREHKPQRRKENGRVEKMGDFDKESSKKQGSLFDAIKNGAKALEKADDYGED